MHLLVIGKSGQLATGINRACSDRSDLTLDQIGRPDLDLERCQDIAGMVAKMRPDVVINAAAYTAVDAAEDEPDTAMRINAYAAGQIARGASMADAPIIHVSTDYVFDGKKSIPYQETDKTAPIGIYGQSKLEGEQRVAEANPCHVITRTSWVYSPYGDNFVRSMLRLGAIRNELGIVADQIGSPTSADDLATALLTVVHRLKENPDETCFGVTHVCGTGIASWYDLAKATFRAASRHGYSPPIVRPITTAEFPTPAKRPANSRLDTGRLRDVFNAELPDWPSSVSRDIERLISTTKS